MVSTECQTTGIEGTRSAQSRDISHAAYVGWMVAGIRTHYENVLSVAQQDERVSSRRVEVFPWHDGGVIERLPGLPDRVKGTLRTVVSTLPIYTAHPLDVLWTQTLIPLTPFLLTRAAASRLPVVLDSDSTPRLLASFGEHYAEQVSGPSLKRRMVDSLLGMAARRCSAIICWSEWAARSYVEDYGVPRERIRIIPPGVDVAAWAPPVKQTTRPNGARVRFLFVGGDFERKGGDLLLDVWRKHFSDTSELHLVTRADIRPEPGVYVYRHFMPNDPELRRLYHTCDALVLPTRGDCFSLASLEAMAAGLPVITSSVGGIPEIFSSGTAGYLIPPNDGTALGDAMGRLIADPAGRAAMGRTAREIAVERFDANKNARHILDLLREVARDR